MSLKSAGIATGGRRPDMNEKRMSHVMKVSGDEFEEIQKKKRTPEPTVVERKQTAIRQFLLFLIFFMIASAIIFRNPLARWLLSLDETMAPQKTSFGQNLRDLSEDTKRQNQLLEQLNH